MTWPVQGIFTSHWNSDGLKPPIDWPKVRAAGYTYAWIKATDFHGGRHITDPSFDRDWELAQASGLLVGSVLYHRPRVDPDSQAHYHLSVLAGAGYGQLPHMLDVEEEPDPSHSLLTDVTLLMALLAGSPVAHAILYANLADLIAHSLYLAVEPPSSLSIANWGRFKTSPSLPAGVTRWRDWQWVCRGNRLLYPKVPGISGDVCLHRFNGATPDFLSWINQPNIPPPLFKLSVTEAERAAILSIAGKLELP